MQDTARESLLKKINKRCGVPAFAAFSGNIFKMHSAKKPAAGLLSNLPSIDELLRTEIGAQVAANAGNKHATRLARHAVQLLRKGIIDSKAAKRTKADLLAAATRGMESAWAEEEMTGTRRVINATGVVIHTNLGRAPLSPAAIEAVTDASRYCSLEYDLVTGKRGRRGGRAEDLIKEITGAEDALIVNNCAAAAFFVLSALAAGGEVVISRGELVEIGGDFRVPDVLTASGATLREVGTTNRTKLADYEQAITRRSKLILRVHPSNYRIVGFTDMPSLGELASLARERGVVLYEDLGSGALIDLGLGEPTAGGSIKAGVDVVTFSGDKLFGAAQAGIIAGRKEIVARLRRQPLYRALRADKLAYAALEATLTAYRRGDAKRDIPVARMLSATRPEIRRRAKALVSRLNNQEHDLRLRILDGVSATGGGAAPGVELETALIGISHPKRTPIKLERALRMSNPPVIARIVNDEVMIDLRTVALDEEAGVVSALISLG